MIDTVSADVLLNLLDLEHGRTLSRLRESGDLAGLAVALTYGVGLPAGREWGTRIERKAWIENQRAAYVRGQAADIVAGLGLDRATLRGFLRDVRKLRGYGPILKKLMRGHQEAK